METTLRQHRRRRGFTLIELLIVVAIIGILAATAIPSFLLYQLRTKSTEAKLNLAAIRVVEESYFSEFGEYVPTAPEPPVIPGPLQSPFDDVGTDYALLGWGPEGDVFFSYGVAVSADLNGYTADAGADIDGDGVVQFWGIVKPDRSGGRMPGAVGCDTTLLAVQQVGPCDPSNGISVF